MKKKEVTSTIGKRGAPTGCLNHGDIRTCLLSGRRAAGIAAVAVTVLGLAGCGGAGPDEKSSVSLMKSGEPSTQAPNQAPNQAMDTTSPKLGDAVQTPVPPPVTGWSSWNSLEENVSSTTIEAQADGLAKLNGLIADKSLQYRFVNIDEGWWLNGLRDDFGDPMVNSAPGYLDQWAGGMNGIAKYINGKGLKAGIYVDAGPMGCGTYWNSQPGQISTGDKYWVGSDPSHYDNDFQKYSSWGFEWVKVDFCGGRAESYSNPLKLFKGIVPIGKDYDPQATYTAISASIRKAVASTATPMVLAITQQGHPGTDPAMPDFNQGPWAWAPGVGNQWRTTEDIYNPGSGTPNFDKVVANFNGNYHPEAQHTGYYNDPDLMVVGMGMPPEQDKAHASLWAISGAPMLIGNDLSKPLSDSTTAVLTNADLLSIDQDSLGLQGILTTSPENTSQVWAKLLTGSGKRAVALFNSGAAPADITVTWDQLGLDPSSRANVSDIWNMQNSGSFTSSYTARQVPPKTVVLLKISGTDVPATAYYPDGTCAAGRTDCQQSFVFKNVASLGFGAFVRIVYTNNGSTRLHAALTTITDPAVNPRMTGKTGRNTVVAFPPTGSAAGSVTVWVPFVAGQNSLALSAGNVPGSADEPLPAVSGILTVGGPVAYSVAYEAASNINELHFDDNHMPTEKLAPQIRSCSACAAGAVVGYIGYGNTLTFKNVMVPSTGTYDVTIAYVDPASPSLRQFSVSSNGGSAIAVTSHSPTADWNTSANATVSLPLKVGSNSITIANPTGWAPDISGIVSISPRAVQRGVAQ